MRWLSRSSLNAPALLTPQSVSYTDSSAGLRTSWARRMRLTREAGTISPLSDSQSETGRAAGLGTGGTSKLATVGPSTTVGGSAIADTWGATTVVLSVVTTAAWLSDAGI